MPPKRVNQQTGEINEAPQSTLDEAFRTAEIMPSEDRAETARRSINKRYMKAETLDDLFDVMEGTTSDALVGRKFEVVGVEWDIYTSSEGREMPLARVDAIDLDTSERDEFITTADGLTHFIRRAQMLNLLPFKARIVERPTRSGQKALNFERV